MDDDLPPPPPPPPGRNRPSDDATDSAGIDSVVYLPGVSPRQAEGADDDVGAIEVLTGCVQVFGLLIKLVLLLGLLALIIWFLVVIFTTPT